MHSQQTSESLFLQINNAQLFSLHNTIEYSMLQFFTIAKHTINVTNVYHQEILENGSTYSFDQGKWIVLRNIGLKNALDSISTWWPPSSSVNIKVHSTLR